MLLKEQTDRKCNGKAMDTLSKEMLFGIDTISFLGKSFLFSFIAVKTEFSVSSSITYCVLESKVHKMKMDLIRNGKIAALVGGLLYRKLFKWK